MSDKKNIAVFTSARSDYGLLKPLITRLKEDSWFNMKLLVAGAHFNEDQGYTYREILDDGFEIDYRLPYFDDDKSRNSVSYANAVLQIQFTGYLSDHPTDLLIVLGDRSELLAVVSTAMLLGVPVAHISGGEVTEGSTDNQVRHAVTKMSHLHFPATEIYKSNIVRMGEEPWRICVSGEPGLDSVLSLPYPTKENLFRSLGLQTGKPVILATFHPETIGNKINGAFITALAEKLLTEYQLLFTASNTDTGGQEINEALEQLAGRFEHFHFVKSLGKLNYYAMMKYADLVLGNSSSGLVEAQSFGIPVVNVGCRQEGRLRNKNVYDAGDDIPAILQAIDTVRQPSFKKTYLNAPNIYGDGKACERIVTFIKDTDFSKLLYKKSVFE